MEVYSLKVCISKDTGLNLNIFHRIYVNIWQIQVNACYWFHIKAIQKMYYYPGIVDIGELWIEC